MFLTIIIPARKASDFIESCLNSVKAQNWLKDSNNNIEVLIGVDACKKTLEKVLEIRNNYPFLRVFYSEENVGPYVIKNSLVDYCNSENILFFDADDIMLPHLVDSIIKHYTDNVIIRYELSLVKYEDYIQKKNRDYGIVNNLIKNLPKKLCYGPIGITKKTFNSINGFLPWMCDADSEFIARCRNNSIKEIDINNILMLRILHDNNLTLKKNTSIKSPLRNIYRIYREYIKKYNLKFEMKKTILLDMNSKENSIDIKDDIIDININIKIINGNMKFFLSGEEIFIKDNEFFDKNNINIVDLSIMDRLNFDMSNNIIENKNEYITIEKNKDEYPILINNNYFTINDFFDGGIFIINNLSSIDNWHKMKERCIDHNIHVTRFEKIDSNNRDIIKKFKMLKLSNKNIMIKNIDEFVDTLSYIDLFENILKYTSGKNVLILNDKVLFHKNFNELFNNQVNLIPKNWKLWYLGANENIKDFLVNDKNILENNLFRNAYNIKGTFSIAIKRDFIKNYILPNLKKEKMTLDKIINLLITNKEIDGIYISYPYLCDCEYDNNIDPNDMKFIKNYNILNYK